VNVFKFGAIVCLIVLLVAMGSGYGIHLKLGNEALNAWALIFLDVERSPWH
jgi:hypothetical protein